MNQLQEKPRLNVVQTATEERRLRILVVNNDEVVTAVVKSAFDPVQGASLEIAPDGESAIRLLATGPGPGTG